MKRFPENVLLQEKACLLFQAMSSKYTEETLRIANSCECVVLAMKQHPAESSLQAAGCMALSELVKDSAVNVRRGEATLSLAPLIAPRDYVPKRAAQVPNALGWRV